MINQDVNSDLNLQKKLLEEKERPKSKKNFMMKMAKKINLKEKEHFFDQFLIDNNLEISEWIRLQSFNFPTTSHSLGNEHLEDLCSYLKREYMYKNGISELNRIDLVDCIEKCINFQKNMMNDPLKIKQYNLLSSKEEDQQRKIEDDLENILDSFKFNHDELFLINRIYYSEVKKYGGHLLPNKIHEKLKIIQVTSYINKIGSINEKIELLLSLLDVYNTGVILKSELDKFITGMCLQNLKSSREILKKSDLAFSNKRFESSVILYNRWIEDLTLLSFFSNLLSPSSLIK